MASALEVNPNELIERAAAMLKEQKLVTPPAWSGYVRTGRHTERPPVEKDWYYMRSAAVLRSVYKLGTVGTSKLRTKYGGKKNRGYKPERFYKGSGAIIRNSLQQLEKVGFLAKSEKGPHKGRKITPKGTSFLDKIASQMLKEGAKHVPVAVAAVAEELPKQT
ncbi:30S ribosomal protein S19e [Candidatus Woesearchaeota archaeon]|nr:30S ribosomal protein S19e [Candidatus Woesearchaeota archaeon]